MVFRFNPDEKLVSIWPPEYFSDLIKKLYSFKFKNK